MHDGPEYETGTLLGANLLISDLEGLNKCITVADDWGLDIISLGNSIGFLMECYEKNIVDQQFLDGIDLKWSSVDATLLMIEKIGKKEGIGIFAGKGVKAMAAEIGNETSKFAIHVKGHELAAWNVPAASEWFGISYVTSNRGACHMNGGTPHAQNAAALRDSLGACSFAASWYKEHLEYQHFLSAITGVEWTKEEFEKAGERIFTMEKMFNYRDGFTREDDVLPDRFYEDAFTYGPKKGSIVDRKKFYEVMDNYYTERNWDLISSRPTDEKLIELDLEFTIDS